jgi:hypothetical protein
LTQNQLNEHNLADWRHGACQTGPTEDRVARPMHPPEPTGASADLAADGQTVDPLELAAISM